MGLTLSNARTVRPLMAPILKAISSVDVGNLTYNKHRRLISIKSEGSND